MRLVAALLVAAVLLAGCTSEDPSSPPGAARIDVDTPTLRQMKEEAGVARCVPGDAEPVEGGLPAVTLPCLGGGPAVDLSALRGPMVVNLWQSTCGPCRTEMPILQRFHERYGDRVAVVGIDYQDVQAVAAMELVQQTGVTYPLLADPQSVLQGAGPFPGMMGLPMFAFVDRQGRASVVAGGVDSEQELLDLVDRHLGIQL